MKPETLALIRLGRLDEAAGLLDGARGLAVGEGATAELVYTSGESDPRPDEETVRTPVLGRRNRVLGTVTVVMSVARARRPQTEPLLNVAARVLAAVVEEGWHSERDVAVAAMTTVHATVAEFVVPFEPARVVALAPRGSTAKTRVAGGLHVGFAGEQPFSRDQSIQASRTLERRAARDVQEATAVCSRVSFRFLPRCCSRWTHSPRPGSSFS